MRMVERFRLRQVMGQATTVGEGVGQIDFSKLITLNTTAVYLWQSAEDRVSSIDDLAILLTERFHIDPAIAQRDAFAIARKWITVEIVQK